MLRLVSGYLKDITPISEAERQFRLTQALDINTLDHWPITNRNIWIALFQRAEKQKENKGFTQNELANLIEHPMLDHLRVRQTVSDIVLVASEGSFDLSRDKFLSKVVFNYDAENEEEARNFFDEDIHDLLRDRSIQTTNVFNRSIQAEEELYWVGKYPRFDDESMIAWLRREFAKNVEPLLQVDEIVKAGMQYSISCSDTNPIVIKRAGIPQRV